MVIKDWEDEYIGGFLMQNGLTVGAVTAFGYEKPAGSTPKGGKTASGFSCGIQTNCFPRWVETPPSSGGSALGSASSPPSYANTGSNGYYYTVCESNYVCVYEESTGSGYPSTGNNPGAIIINNFENLWGTSGGTPPSEADHFFNQMAWAGVYFSEEEKVLIRAYPNLLIPYIREIGTKPSGPNFKLSNDDIVNYPKFATLVKNLKTFLLNEPTVMAALKKYSGFTESDILKMLEFGKGPSIVIEEMTGRFGFYNRAIPNILKISASWVRGLELASLPSTQRGTAFLLAVTILHEFVHYGRFVNDISNTINGKPFEMGLGFEQATFGIIIDATNATQYSYKFYKLP